MKVAIIGGGAAGFFSAINLKENYPKAQVSIFEKSPKPLAKVKVSGGGRCNLTNACSRTNELIKAYPRGGKELKKAFGIFSTKHAFEWFENRGVPLVTQDDDCVFPESQDAQSIINCFLKECRRLNIELITRQGVSEINPIEKGFELSFENDTTKHRFDKVIVTTGGSPKRWGLNWLEKLGHEIEHPVPSLFTFNMPNETITKLMGIVVENASINMQGTKLSGSGPLLITHWGMSGPAVLKLSAFGARLMSEKQYDFKVQVNWVNENNTDVVLEKLKEALANYPQKLLVNVKPFAIQERLWVFLIEKAGLSPQKKCGELGKKGLNKLANTLSNDEYSVRGKTTFREEFVTCGGVSLESVDMKTMESKIHQGLFFAGEVLDIDAITGGFNLQAAWTTGFIAAKLSQE